MTKTEIHLNVLLNHTLTKKWKGLKLYEEENQIPYFVPMEKPQKEQLVYHVLLKVAF